MIETWVCWKRENKSKGKQIDEKPEFLFGISLYFSSSNVFTSGGWGSTKKYWEGGLQENLT